MELENKVLTDKTATIKHATNSSKLPSTEHKPEVYRTRTILLILISILIVSNQ